MSECLTHKESERPTFSDILNTLATRHEAIVTYNVPPDEL